MTRKPATSDAPPRNSAGRLSLALRPVIPYRCPDGYPSIIRYGYDLRLPGGPRLARHDPLLAAFGAQIAVLDEVEEDTEGLQHEGFDPGRDVAVSVERRVDGTAAIGIWDAMQIRRAGQLDAEGSALALAAISHDLERRNVVLDETRTAPDNRRVGLTLLMFAVRFVRLNVARATPYTRPLNSARRRIVASSRRALRASLVGQRPDCSPGPDRRTPNLTQDP